MPEQIHSRHKSNGNTSFVFPLCCSNETSPQTETWSLSRSPQGKPSFSKSSATLLCYLTEVPVLVWLLLAVIMTNADQYLPSHDHSATPLRFGMGLVMSVVWEVTLSTRLCSAFSRSLNYRNAPVTLRACWAWEADFLQFSLWPWHYCWTDWMGVWFKPAGGYSVVSVKHIITGVIPSSLSRSSQ